MNFQHFLISRFNVVMPWKGYYRPDEEWCLRRASLFEEFCLPSVANQSNSNFEWLVLFDKSGTPFFLKERMEKYHRMVPSFTPVYMDVFEPDHLQQVIKSRIDPGVLRVVTTRLDTDDVISSRYIEYTQDVLNENPGFLGFINFDCGYFFEDGKSYTHRSAHNAFFSCVEQNTIDFKTCHHFNHNTIQQHGSVINITEGKWFVFSNHDNNISGRRGEKMREYRVRNRELFDEFGLLAFKVDESLVELVLENFFLITRKAYGLTRRIVRNLSGVGR